MPRRTSRRVGTAAIAVAFALALSPAVRARSDGQEPQEPSRDAFRFRSAVDLVNVTATVIDRHGRFVSGLRQEDFRLYEDEEPQEVTHFSAERVPVSLGIALDTSGSMAGEKMAAARSALDRFLFDLLGPEDEIFLYRIAEPPDLIEGWSTDRRRLSSALRGVRPEGGTAMYDAVADALPMAQEGRHAKKALLVISDGNDTSSRTTVRELRGIVRETEVLVYAIGIDGRGERTMTRTPRTPIPIPWPIPMPGRRGPSPWPQPPTRNPGGTWGGASGGGGDGVNVGALREMTDDSGGRTELVRSVRDLDPATAGIADELSRQYYLGYTSTRPKDGRWHTIRVDVRGQSYIVRARRGYMASR